MKEIFQTDMRSGIHTFLSITKIFVFRKAKHKQKNLIGKQRGERRKVDREERSKEEKRGEELM